MHFFLSPFSSRPSQAQRDKVDLKLDLAGLEFKLHEVHFAVKFSETEFIMNSYSSRAIYSGAGRLCAINTQKAAGEYSRC